MKKPLQSFIGSLLLAGFATGAMAETEAYYSNVSPNDGAGPQYTTSATPPAPPADEHPRDPHDRFVFSYGIDDSHVAFSADAPYTRVEVQSSHHHHHHHRIPLQWVDREMGQPLPVNAVVASHLSRPPFTTFVCRSTFRNGVYPGKLQNGYCHISLDGEEVALPDYQVLVSRAALAWLPANDGQIPVNAVAGGYDGDDTLYICKAHHQGNDQVGKLVGESCVISWKGQELMLPRYQVLAM